MHYAPAGNGTRNAQQMLFLSCRGVVHDFFSFCQGSTSHSLFNFLSLSFPFDLLSRKLSTVKEKVFVGENFVFVGENFVPFRTKPFVWNLIAHFWDFGPARTRELTLGAGHRRFGIEVNLVLFQIYESKEFNSLRKFLPSQYLRKLIVLMANTLKSSKIQTTSKSCLTLSHACSVAEKWSSSECWFRFLPIWIFYHCLLLIECLRSCRQSSLTSMESIADNVDRLNNDCQAKRTNMKKVSSYSTVCVSQWKKNARWMASTSDATNASDICEHAK